MAIKFSNLFGHVIKGMWIFQALQYVYHVLVFVCTVHVKPYVWYFSHFTHTRYWCRYSVWPISWGYSAQVWTHFLLSRKILFNGMLTQERYIYIYLHWCMHDLHVTLVCFSWHVKVKLIWVESSFSCYNFVILQPI